MYSFFAEWVIAAVKNITVCIFAMATWYTTVKAQPVQQITPSAKLVSAKVNGGMGVSVVWNPGLKRYYSAVSGTGEKWLMIFNQQGQSIRNPYLLPFDPGSLWIEGSGNYLRSYAAGMEGLYVIHLREGLPAYAENIFYALHNPVAIGNGAWVSKRKEMWYFHDKTVYRYKIRNAYHRTPLQLDLDEFENEINSMGMVYTGIRQSEIGLYDRGQHRILLFNARNGKCSRILQIADESGPKPLCGDFAFANGLFWLYDRETGIWYGYR
jgi:hypothetical protein